MTMGMVAILVYTTKECNYNSTVIVHQHGSYDVTCKPRIVLHKLGCILCIQIFFKLYCKPTRLSSVFLIKMFIITTTIIIIIIIIITTIIIIIITTIIITTIIITVITIIFITIIIIIVNSKKGGKQILFPGGLPGFLKYLKILPTFPPPLA